MASSGGNVVQVLDVKSGTVHISNLIIESGDLTVGGLAGKGAGINNSGTLTLTNSLITGNTMAKATSGGGIYNSATGTLTLSNSTVSSHTVVAPPGYEHGGGGIANDGVMTVNDCIIAHNSAGSGGGINNYAGTLTVSNSIISYNDTVSGFSGGPPHRAGWCCSSMNPSIRPRPCCIAARATPRSVPRTSPLW